MRRKQVQALEIDTVNYVGGKAGKGRELVLPAHSLYVVNHGF